MGEGDHRFTHAGRFPVNPSRCMVLPFIAEFAPEEKTIFRLGILE
jgi:hypothetical protein